MAPRCAAVALLATDGLCYRSATRYRLLATTAGQHGSYILNIIIIVYHGLLFIVYQVAGFALSLVQQA